MGLMTIRKGVSGWAVMLRGNVVLVGGYRENKALLPRRHRKARKARDVLIEHR